MEYKIEQKTNLWQIILRRGEYSGYEEEHFFIAANNPDEAWFLFTKYLDFSGLRKDAYGGYYSPDCCYFVKWGEKKFAPKNFKYDDVIYKNADTIFERCLHFEAEIKMLPVIYIDKL